MRITCRQVRGKIPFKKEKEEAIKSLLFNTPEIKKAKDILAYYPLTGEINIKDFFPHLLKMGKKIYLPFFSSLKIGPFGGDLKYSGRYKGYEPATQAELEPDLVILPGLAFSKDGYRLGYGSGWYDRYLAGLGSKPFIIALSFSELLLPDLPHEAHDVRADLIITPEEVIRV